METESIGIPKTFTGSEHPPGEDSVHEPVRTASLQAETDPENGLKYVIHPRTGERIYERDCRGHYIKFTTITHSVECDVLSWPVGYQERLSELTSSQNDQDEKSPPVKP